MSRFIAIADKKNLSEDQFRSALNRTGKWRFAKRGWIVKAYCASDSGKVVIEGEAPDKEMFEEWLNNNGWGTDNIHQVNFIHEAGLVWPMQS